jgi:hypothetical protein
MSEAISGDVPERGQCPYGQIVPMGSTPIQFNQLGAVKPQDQDDIAYILGYVNPGMQPAIQSAKTGHIFVLDWNTVVAFAIDKGVDEVQVIAPSEPKLIIPH